MNPASTPDQLSDDGRLKHLAVYGALATAASVAIIALGERPNPFLLVLGVAVACFGAGYVLSGLLRPEAKIIALTKRENRRFLIIQSIAIFAGYLYYCFAAPHAARSPDAQPSRLTEWIAAPLRSEAGNAGEQEIAAPDPATQKEWIAISAECADAEDPVACARTAD